MEFIRTAKKFSIGPKRFLRDNDYFTDRLSHRHTTQILIVLIVLSTFKRFYQSPITCWVPAELKRYEKYINRYCWIRGTYYVNQSYDLNTLSIEARDESLLHYYQWVYFFLIIQAFLFYVPRILWCFISHRMLGYDLFNLIDAGMQYEQSGKNPNLILAYINSNLMNKCSHFPIKSNNLTSKDDESSFLSGLITDISRKISKSLLTATYILIKTLYMVIAVFQIYMMNAFLSNKAHSFYGKIVIPNV
jgi:hypothetical protein